MHFHRNKVAAVLLLTLLASPAVSAVELEQFGGAAHAYPAMRDLDGKELADGEFTQQIQDSLLRIQITYDLADGARIEEKAAFQQRPELIQKEWSWRELRRNSPTRIRG